MSVRRLLAEHIDSRSLMFKFIVGRRRSGSGIKCLTHLCISSGQNVNRLQIFSKKLFQNSSSYVSWKWLFAIPLVYAGYDNQSELLYYKSIIFGRFYNENCYLKKV